LIRPGFRSSLIPHPSGGPRPISHAPPRHAAPCHARPPIYYRKFRYHHVGRPARHRGSHPRTSSGPLFHPSTRYHVTPHRSRSISLALPVSLYQSPGLGPITHHRSCKVFPDTPARSGALSTQNSRLSTGVRPLSTRNSALSTEFRIAAATAADYDVRIGSVIPFDAAQDRRGSDRELAVGSRQVAVGSNSKLPAANCPLQTP